MVLFQNTSIPSEMILISYAFMRYCTQFDIKVSALAKTVEVSLAKKVSGNIQPYKQECYFTAERFKEVVKKLEGEILMSCLE